MVGVLMAITGAALILASMQPWASAVIPGGGTGPSSHEVKLGPLQKAVKPGQQKKSSANSGCPMLKVPKVSQVSI